MLINPSFSVLAATITIIYKISHDCLFLACLAHENLSGQDEKPITAHYSKSFPAKSNQNQKEWSDIKQLVRE